MGSSKARSTGAHHRKRTGQHQRHTKPFLKTYLPYLPLLTMILTGIAFSLRLQSSPVKSVLAFATQVSAPTLLEETNTQRNQNGQPSLKVNDKLTQAAQAKANDMASRNYWSHTTPDGQQPWIFLEQAGYAYQKAGENLAYGFNTSKATVAGWMNSPSHKANLLDGGYDEVGFGYANASNYQSAGASTIIVALYGRSQLAAAAAPTDANSETANQVVHGDLTSASELTNVKTYRIARIQIITNGQAPWSLWAIILAAFIGVTIITLKHGLAVRRMIVRGERFVLKHPLFDVTLAAFVVLCVFISRVEGYILAARF